MNINININENIKNSTNVYLLDNNYNISNINTDLCNYLKSKKSFDAKLFSKFSYINNLDSYLLVGLGDVNKISVNDFRKIGFDIAKFLKDNKLKYANINYISIDVNNDSIYLKALIEGVFQSEYKFDTYKTKEKNNSIDLNININLGSSFDFDNNSINKINNLVEGINITRELTNTPAIDMYPEVLANKAKELLEPLGVKVTIFDKNDIENLSMTAFLSVAEGSDKEPKFIKMEYIPVRNGEVLALVGKGLTYDSGGYAIKPPLGMSTMMGDMAGSATVIGTIYAIAKNNIGQNVVGLVAACENMISGKAYKNGDIVKSMKGTTIEVKNTDAEGRVTLADSLYYAATKTNATAIIDLATLTGACVVGLGDYTTGIVTNDDNIYNKLYQSSVEAGEYVWKLPIVDELREQVKSKIADITNSTGKPGGAITAGIFLEEFVEGKSWAHMDIAGPASTESEYGYIPRGATGIPVKTLYNFVKNFNLK
ncbi:leucyl aminopeptidase [Miniphocaeibacter massiliensis]|uniref:leucyl aminopeptidase n=1 Tax=Miniphocaeibacter massiliensis TaxID=2041841 RepID=UPI0013EE04E0|nr:leucyl aminopeptidase [Miniphocaeibacter massiliensis]